MTTYLFDYATVFINKTQYRNGQKAASSLLQKSDLGNTKNYRGITYTVTATKVYNTMLQNSIQSEIKKIRFSEKSIHHFTDSDDPANPRECTCRKTRGNSVARRFLESIWFHTQKKDGANPNRILPFLCQKQNRYSYHDALKNTRAIVCSPDGDIDFFDIVPGVLQGDR